MRRRLGSLLVFVFALVTLQAQTGQTQDDIGGEAMNMVAQPGAFPTEITAFDGPYNVPIELPSGEWNMIANGRVYTLGLIVENDVVTRATFSSGDIENITFDPDTSELAFERVLPSLRQQFTGYLFQYDESDPLWRLAGTFQSGESNSSGWYATLPK